MIETEEKARKSLKKCSLWGVKWCVNYVLCVKYLILDIVDLISWENRKSGFSYYLITYLLHNMYISLSGTWTMKMHLHLYLQ